MAKKEDNRDVFDKALDYAPAVGGAVVGGVLGRKIAGKMGSKHRRSYGETKRNQDQITDEYNSYPSSTWDRQAIDPRPSSGEVSRVRRVFGFSKDKNAAAKMIGTVAGGAAGAAMGGAYSESKRRK